MSSRAARRDQRRRARRRIVLALGAALAVFAAGFTAYAVTRSDGTDVATPEPRPTTTTQAPTTSTTGRDPRRGNGQPVTFAFGGDVHFEGVLRPKLAADPATVFVDVAPVLSAADVAVVNLETAITEGDTAIPNKEWNFKTPATSLDAVRAAGVDAVSVANNHGIDFGPQGLVDTLAARAAKQFPVLGVGANAAEAYMPLRLDIKGQRIAIFAATDVLGEEHVASWTATESQPGLASTKYEAEATMIATIQFVRPTVDTVVVFLHWGVERTDCPSPRQAALARSLVDAGADIVVGSHAHHLLGGGRLGTAFVDYGLGNFAFFNESGEYGRTGVLLVTATGRDTDAYQWVPARIRGGVPVPYPAGAEADAELAHWNELRACTDLAP
jgi:poly-gamma-glutamate synthesis protein (capsule biosynthesis protein)